MTAAATAARKAFFAAMDQVAVGAQLARRRRIWTITKRTRMDCSVRLQLRHGRRDLVVYVPVCHSGPCLSDVDMRAVAAAPMQRDLMLVAEGGAA